MPGDEEIKPFTFGDWTEADQELMDQMLNMPDQDPGDEDDADDEE